MKDNYGIFLVLLLFGVVCFFSIKEESKSLRYSEKKGTEQELKLCNGISVKSTPEVVSRANANLKKQGRC
jgi:hypothetical protein